MLAICAAVKRILRDNGTSAASQIGASVTPGQTISHYRIIEKEIA